jgi:SpoVK/Ycf46/Vps4 family AAA+-type ATPase
MPSKPLRKTAKARTPRSSASVQAKPSLRKIHVSRVSPSKAKTPISTAPATAQRIWFVGDDAAQRNSAAQALADKLQLKLERVDPAQIVSRYIGETEKNVNRLFTQAIDQRWLLFFDEADALFGKRSEVKDSHDRYANVELAYLLERIEQSSAPVVIATKVKPALDPAVLRKLAQLVELPVLQTSKEKQGIKRPSRRPTK